MTNATDEGPIFILDILFDLQNSISIYIHIHMKIM